ncbi:uncharacterized protein AC631_00271 [Debaryomyces fabryi]|uniref:V-type ATPase assembly factor PKR1 n=1 Tax=Debaryomyces fabryi TaxID=58627 RepID=A0A0V1Q671_9ASCO|nr:uncharacterized protein AC631_00271 [Debaryomyces fabryi]KSA04001.1 hypothetical protein AC631_00271 [Debaryomyces fabryi]CUM53757.1 unnamed protein product [Debaryomyces fabryi]
MSFFVELWESVFTPGTTPALIKATHASFIMLIISLLFLIYLSGSIHFINLLVIALMLYGSVIWFINELNKAKLKDNAALEKEDESAEKEVKLSSDKDVANEKSTEAESTGASKGISKPIPAKKRKA